jgi:hypothetical protein
VKGKRQNDDKLNQNLYPLTLILGPQRQKVKGKRQNDDKLKQNLYPLTLILGPQRIVEKRFLASEERSFSAFIR